MWEFMGENLSYIGTHRQSSKDAPRVGGVFFACSPSGQWSADVRWGALRHHSRLDDSLEPGIDLARVLVRSAAAGCWLEVFTPDDVARTLELLSGDSASQSIDRQREKQARDRQHAMSQLAPIEWMKQAAREQGLEWKALSDDVIWDRMAEDNRVIRTSFQDILQELYVIDVLTEPPGVCPPASVLQIVRRAIRDRVDKIRAILDAARQETQDNPAAGRPPEADPATSMSRDVHGCEGAGTVARASRKGKTDGF